MTEVTLTSLDAAVAAFRTKMAELTVAKASTQEIINQLDVLRGTLAPNVSADQVFGTLLFNDPNGLNTVESQETMKGYINRMAVNDATGYVNLIQDQMLGRAMNGFGVISSFVFAGSEHQIDGVTENLTTGTTQVFAAAAIVTGVVGLVSGGLGLASAVDDYLQLKAQGVGGSELTSATLAVANQSLGIAGNISTIVQSAVVLGFYAADQAASATAAFGYGLIPSLSQAAVGASAASVAVGVAAVGLGSTVALAQLGITAFNFAETVKGWQAADANGMPVSVETKALASTSFALNSLAGIVGVAAGISMLVFPPVGVIVGVVAAVIGAIAAVFDWITSYIEFATFKDQIYSGTDGNDSILAKHLEFLQVHSGGGDDLIKPVPQSGFGPVDVAGNLVDGGTGTDTLDVSGNDEFISKLSQPENTVSYITLGGSWVLRGSNLAQIRNIENVLGSTYRDDITGDSGNNLLMGRSGDDTIRGGQGNDLISGGAGYDDLDGGEGIDTISYSLDGADGSSSRGGFGIYINLENQTVEHRWTGASLDRIANFENAIGSDGDDDMAGSAVANLLVGRQGSDYITGGKGNDTLSGGWGEDSLYGGDDIDTVDYRLDSDEASGHAGNGFIVDLVQGKTTTVADPNLVADYLYSIENVIGSNANDIIRGNDLNNVLFGEGGDDSIDGGKGNDILAGGAGRDTLDGGEDIDTANFVSEGADVFLDLVRGGTFSQEDYYLGTGTAYDVLRNIENVITGSGNDGVRGNDLNNLVILGAGLDEAYGQGGNDTILGGDGDDYVYGGAENDLLSGGHGSDRLDGGTGIDTVTFGIDQGDAISGWRVDLAAQYTYRLAGDDVAGASTREDEIRDVENLVGGDRNDWFTGNALANILSGGGGNDKLEGADGDDMLIGGAGDDKLYGGKDNDLLSGGAGVDTLDGGEGIDTVSYSVDAAADKAARGGAGVDVNLMSGEVRERYWGSIIDRLSNIENVIGSDANDAITGDKVANTLMGMEGDDYLSGDEGNDTLIGGEGDDTIHGGKDADILSGGAGFDWLDGGEGVDTLSYSFDAADGKATRNGAGVDIDLTTGEVRERYLGALIDRVFNFENVIGSDGDDAITGDGLANTLVGMEGKDALSGGSGNDTLVGGAGDDKLYGGKDNDLLSGGAGFDTLDGGEGIDTVSYSIDLGDRKNTRAFDVGVDINLMTGDVRERYWGDVIDKLSSIENVIGSDGDDAIMGDGLANTLVGMEGNDAIDGNAGNDALSGGQGNDSLTGGLGNDYLSGGAGADTLDGGADNDTALFSEEDARWSIDLTAGTAARGNAAGAAFVAEDTLRNIENVVTGIRDDSVTGNDLANQIATGAGNDTIHGGAGNDMLSGDAGNDLIHGGANDDIIVGGTGDDTIDGGADRDTVAYSEGLAAAMFAAYGTTLAGFDITIDQTTHVKAMSTDGGVLKTDRLTNVEGILGSDRSETTRVNAVIAFSTDAGRGVDTLDLSGLGTTAGAYVNLANGSVTLVQANATVAQSHLNYENVTGTGTFDTLIGNDSNNVINGGGGNDMLIGLNGADRLDGGAGTDTASYVSSLAAVTVNLATGSTAGGEAQGDTLISIENLIGSRYADMLTGDGGANQIGGGAGNDTLIGGSGDDTLIGGSENDLLSGGEGLDALDGGDGIDTVSYSIDPANDGRAAYLGIGVDVNLQTGEVRERFWGSIIDRLSNIENVTGSDGNDALYGNGIANVLMGMDGNDYLAGAGGNDTLTGGAGADSFVFAFGTGQDVIQDFAADDVISLKGFAGVDSFQHLLNIASQVGNDVVLHLNATDQVVLKNHTVAQLQADDFIFA